MPNTTVKTPLKRQHLVLVRPGFEMTLKDEFSERFEITGEVSCRAGIAFDQTVKLPELDQTVFARQYLPRAVKYIGADNEQALKFLIDRINVMVGRSNRQSGQWTLHAFAIDDDPSLARARSLGKKLLANIQNKQKELFKRYISNEDFASTARQTSDVLIQIYCPAQDSLWFSISTIADGISTSEGGFKRMKSLRGAPSRSASKLEEALSFMGSHPKKGETAVDLGAAPGGWSFVLARHGANVKAIDHAELAIDQKKLLGTIEHIKANGLKFTPDEPVDWLVCDMVMGAKETLNVLKKWQENDTMKNFVVNVKLPKSNPWPLVSQAVKCIESFGWAHVRARQLIHDRSEITLIGCKKISRRT
jgi:23S rRNA (cytidine2498-2'-O)-methyltransferase